MFISVIYAWPLPGPDLDHCRDWNLYCLWAACHWLSVAARTMLSCVLQLQLSPLQITKCCTLAIALHLVILKFNHTHLKFTVYGTSKQANIHMHVRNAVPLVWGSLRLAPITHFVYTFSVWVLLSVTKDFKCCVLNITPSFCAWAICEQLSVLWGLGQSSLVLIYVSSCYSKSNFFVLPR